MYATGSSALLLPLTRGRTSLPSPLKQENVEVAKSAFTCTTSHPHMYTWKRGDGKPLPQFLEHLSPPNRWPKETPSNWGGLPTQTINPVSPVLCNATYRHWHYYQNYQHELTDPFSQGSRFTNAPTMPLHPQLPLLCQLHPLLCAASQIAAWLGEPAQQEKWKGNVWEAFPDYKLG